MAIIEYAKRNRADSTTPIEHVPAFRKHLQRNGLRDLADWERHNRAQATGSGTDALTTELRQRYAAVQHKK